MNTFMIVPIVGAAFALIIATNQAAAQYGRNSSSFENKYEADDLPSTDNYSPATGGVIAEAGILTLDHQGDGGDIEGFTPSFFQAKTPDYWNVTDSNGWTLEFRLKMDGREEATGAYQMQTRIGDADHQQIYRFFQNRIDAVGGGLGTILDEYDLTDDFHTFRVAQEAPADGDSSISHVWVDNVLIASVPAGFSGDPQMWWGCGGSGCNSGTSGEVKVDYLRWTANGAFWAARTRFVAPGLNRVFVPVLPSGTLIQKLRLFLLFIESSTPRQWCFLD